MLRRWAEGIEGMEGMLQRLQACVPGRMAGRCCWLYSFKPCLLWYGCCSCLARSGAAHVAGVGWGHVGHNIAHVAVAPPEGSLCAYLNVLLLHRQQGSSCV